MLCYAFFRILFASIFSFGSVFILLLASKHTSLLHKVLTVMQIRIASTIPPIVFVRIILKSTPSLKT